MPDNILDRKWANICCTRSSVSSKCDTYLFSLMKLPVVLSQNKRVVYLFLMNMIFVSQYCMINIVWRVHFTRTFPASSSIYHVFLSGDHSLKHFVCCINGPCSAKLISSIKLHQYPFQRTANICWEYSIILMILEFSLFL